MNIIKRTAFAIALLGFLVGDTTCRADSKEITRDGIYVVYNNGIVRDTHTGLEWKVGPDKDTNWNEAKIWVEKLELDGGGWRMPTIDELKSLYKKGSGDRNMTPQLKTTGYYVWAAETNGLSGAENFDFYDGRKYCLDRSSSYNGRAFGVRSLNN